MAAVIGQRDALELSGYLNSVGSRIQALQRTSVEFSKQINQLSINVATRRESLSYELKGLKQDVVSLKDDIRSLQKAIIQLITELKGSTKADEMERFKKRIDLWAPEHFVTKSEASRALEDA